MSKISEFVSLGHPDKIADYISEFILDELIKKDKKTTTELIKIFELDKPIYAELCRNGLFSRIV